MAAHPEKLLTAKEVAERLSISRVTLWRLARDGKIEAHRIGKQLRFDREEVEAFIKRTSTRQPKK
jgi:excisionase family DNA binding protein